MNKIPDKESLTVEFKSDLKGFPDNELIEVVDAMTNTSGGDLFLGVEDDGSITGIQPYHEDTIGVRALIMNRTVPSVTTESEIIKLKNNKVLHITIPISSIIVATSEGKVLKRRLKLDGTPENVPFYPFEMNTRLSDLNHLDYSSQIVPNATVDDLNPNERVRLRQLIRLNNGERNLLDLDDTELDKALGLIKEIDGEIKPTVTGLLLLGKEDRLKELIPTAQTSFQLLNGTKVKTNRQFTKPLLETFEILLNYFRAQNEEEEIQIDFSRVAIPNYSEKAFREGLINAFSHRDYTILQANRILLDNEGLTITSPGSFLSDINLKNLISIEPQSRNPNLADALKRIGLAEKTGRGIDRIFEESIRYGKLLPDYSESNSRYVRLFIPKVPADIEFTRMISETSLNIGRDFTIIELIILNYLKDHEAITLKLLSEILSINQSRLLNSLNTLVSLGILETSNSGQKTRYRLSKDKYQPINSETTQTFHEIVSRDELINFIKDSGNEITRKQVSEHYSISKDSAYRILKKLKNQGILKLIKKGSSSKYILTNTETI